MKWTRGWLKGVGQGMFPIQSSRSHRVPQKICGFRQKSLIKQINHFLNSEKFQIYLAIPQEILYGNCSVFIFIGRDFFKYEELF
jgi:hypothetical protein